MNNAMISYIMSCSDDEFERVTGVRLPEDAWEKWSTDMYERTEQLQRLFERSQGHSEFVREKLADSLQDLDKWSDLVRTGKAEVTSVSFKRVEK